jgi:hypothetical protein
MMQPQTSRFLFARFWWLLLAVYSSCRPRSIPDAEATDMRLRRCCASSGLVRLGSMIALSNAYGRPRCRPLIYHRQWTVYSAWVSTMSAHMISLLRTWNWEEKDALTVGYPIDKPTVPYPLTTSKRTLKILNHYPKKSISFPHIHRGRRKNT